MTAFNQAGVDPAVLQAQAQASQAKSGARAAASGAAKGNQGIARAAQEFEAMFLSQLLQPMFEGVKMSPLAGDGPGSDIYKEMLVKEYGKTVAEAGGVGIADTVKQEMLRIQEQAGS